MSVCFFVVLFSHLSSADLLVNTLCLPFTLVYTLQGEWKFGSALCFLLPYAQGLAVHVSTVTLNVIALDRHRSVCSVGAVESRDQDVDCRVLVVLQVYCVSSGDQDEEGRVFWCHRSDLAAQRRPGQSFGHFQRVRLLESGAWTQHTSNYRHSPQTH